MLRAALTRRLVALGAIVALVLAQALVAANGCVLPAPADEAPETCHHDGSERPAADALCKAHCEASTQTVDQGKPLVAPDPGAPLAVLRAEPVVPTAAAGTSRWLAHTGAPPPYLLHRRLRI